MNIMSAQDWFRNICSTKVGDLVKDKPPIISVNCMTTIGDTLDILREMNVTAVGVYGEVGHWLGNPKLVCAGKQYIGLISIVDIIAYLCKCDTVESSLLKHVSNVIGSTNESLTIWTEDFDRALFFAMEQFCRGTHHAFCTSSAPNIEPRMLSQSDIVRFLLDHETVMPHATTVFGQEVRSIATDISTFVTPDDTMQYALACLIEHHAIPVLNADGTVLTTLSATDMKGVLSTMIALIAPMTVMDFLLYIHGDVIPSPYSLSASTSIREAAHAMISHGFHRVWVSPDGPTQRASVVSMTDVIRSIFTADLPRG